MYSKLQGRFRAGGGRHELAQPAFPAPALLQLEISMLTSTGWKSKFCSVTETDAGHRLMWT